MSSPSSDDLMASVNMALELETFLALITLFILIHMLLLYIMPLFFAEVRLNPQLNLELSLKLRLSRAYRPRLILPWWRAWLIRLQRIYNF